MDSMKIISSAFLDMDPLTLVLILGVAFAVLILIIQLIYVCKVYPKNQVSKVDKVENIGSGPTIASSDHASLMDDKELVAVIMAAIYASMGPDVPKDGLVVRSIRKIK